MLNQKDILQTQDMIDKRHLDIRTITMGISLLDCIDSSGAKSRQKIYDKITRLAENLVKEGERIENELGIPIVNKRISVTPISLIAGSSDDLEFVCYDSGNDASGIFYAGLWLDYAWIWIFRRNLNIDATVKKHNFL